MKGDQTMTTAIYPAELARLRSSGKPVQLIDVRTPAEFQEVHVDFARNVPLDQLEPEALTQGEKGEALYVICRSGNRGEQACRKLEAVGLDVVNVEGGTLAWEAAGLPVVRGARKVISLERQVRIAAGSLVLVGSVLGMVVHPYLAGFSAFIGAGLMFSGITDTCGMAMVLARMPWNQVKARHEPACCSK
jgi:rhodanese-related sulfurtransferase